MRVPSSVLIASLCAVSTLLLAGCGGSPGMGGGGSQTTSFALTVTGASSGTGTITSKPAGINCPGTCTASFPQNTQVTLTETPGTNYFFGGWTGCSGATTCSVTMTAAETVGATFNAGVGLTVATTGSGSVTSSPAGIDCPTTCSALFAPNSKV